MGKFIGGYLLVESSLVNGSRFPSFFCSLVTIQTSRRYVNLYRKVCHRKIWMTYEDAKEILNPCQSVAIAAPVLVRLCVCIFWDTCGVIWSHVTSGKLCHLLCQSGVVHQGPFSPWFTRWLFRCFDVVAGEIEGVLNLCKPTLTYVSFI